MMSVRERTRSEHEERLEAEVGRLREQSAKELADIRASGREVYERENETLREARKDTLQVGCKLCNARASVCVCVCVNRPNKFSCTPYYML